MNWNLQIIACNCATDKMMAMHFKYSNNNNNYFVEKKIDIKQVILKNWYLVENILLTLYCGDRFCHVLLQIKLKDCDRTRWGQLDEI